MWSAFEKTYYTKINDKYLWITELIFYYEDLSHADFKTDWRFCEVPNKRKQCKFLGTVETEFPIKYPLVLSNGLIINENTYTKMNTEKLDGL